MKTWPMLLTENELIALSRVCTRYADMLLNSGGLTPEEVQILHELDRIDDKMPDDSWFAEEVRR